MTKQDKLDKQHLEKILITQKVLNTVNSMLVPHLFAVRNRFPLTSSEKQMIQFAKDLVQKTNDQTR